MGLFLRGRGEKARKCKKWVAIATNCTILANEKPTKKYCQRGALGSEEGCCPHRRRPRPHRGQDRRRLRQKLQAKLQEALDVLSAAREAGVFHPNCTHRLEYLSPTEYPKGAWDEFADRVGEPGAFGDPLKTNAGLESKAAKEAEEAREKNPIGKTGDWESLRLPPLATISPNEGKSLIDEEEAIARLRRGETIADVFGTGLDLGELARRHIMEAKDRPREVVKQRLSNLNNVIETLHNPLEVWKSEKKPYTTYIALIKDRTTQKAVLHVVVRKGTRVYSWHLNDREFEHGRNGTLLYRRPE